MIPLTIVAISLFVLLGAIFVTGQWKYFSEARAMTAAGFAITMIPAFYTVFGTSYQIDLMNWHGVEQWWLYAVSWYPAYILGILIGGAIRATGPHLTLPDRFMQYGGVSELLASVISFFYLMPLDVMLSFGYIAWPLVGYALPLELFIVLLGAFLIYFTATKGWTGYSLGGVVFFVFMVLGVGVASLMLIPAAGGWAEISAGLPTNLLIPWIGDFSGFMRLLTQPANLVWFLMGFAFIVDPMVWQRFSLTDSESSVRKGMAFAFIFWIIFDIATVFIGLTVSQLGALHYPGETVYYLDIAYEFLPQLWAGLMIAGNLMAALAGGSAYLHAGGMIFAQNIAKSLGLLRQDALARDEESKRWYTRGVALHGVITLVVILILNIMMPDDPTTMAWLVLSGILISGLAWPAIFGGVFLRDKVPASAVTYNMIFKDFKSLSLSEFFRKNPAMLFGMNLTFGILPSTATGTPFIDASRILGFAASIVGWIIGWVIGRTGGE